MTITLIGFTLALTGCFFLFQGAVIPSPLFPLGAAGTLLAFYLMHKWSGKITISPVVKRLVGLTVTLFIVMFLSAMAYEVWQWEQMVTREFMMKMTLLLFGTLGIYLNVMFMRAESAYRKKRGNQRITEQPQEGYTEYKKDLKQSKSKNSEEIVTVLGNSLEHSDTPIVWKGKDMFTHMLVVGATRSGKTASVLEPMIYQLLMQKKQGKKLGLSVVEPKGEFAEKVKEFCDEMDIPYIYIDPTSPDTHKFNPMEGNVEDVVEGTVIVLRGLFGKQDAFFANVQELAARNVTRLLKELKGDEVDLMEVLETLRDLKLLEQRTNELRMRDGETDLVHSIENELLGSMAEKYKQFVIGLRAQLENITSNELLKNIMCGKSDLEVDEHFANDGVLIVNTALGTLKKAGDAFGQFLIMHLQNGTFRRPGTEDTRTPHFMFIDEYKRYINPQVEIFLSLAASYKVSGILASQSLGQLEVEAGDISPRAMKQAIMTNCRNKLCFNGIGFRDAQEFADEFGKDKIVMRQSTYKHRIFLPNLFPDSYRDTESEEYRFDPTDIMDNLPKYSFIHKIMYEAAMQKPSLARGNLVPADWKEKREWEGNRLRVRLHNGLKKAGAGTMARLKRISNVSRTLQQSHTVQPANHTSMERTVGHWGDRQAMEETKHVSMHEEPPSTPVQHEPPTVADQDEIQNKSVDEKPEPEPSNPVDAPIDYLQGQIENDESATEASKQEEESTQEMEHKNQLETAKPKASSDGFWD
ncbi:type IV secretory system conjugative DNA transfer family protein [Virgibacillus xinjiangensis]|uniref:Type IV secretory system conjugative DNA transfer family protein n=1 Tax=Virgibacillus xinjiangensis TaxID=393090 RepID=A0ABV7CZ74_9BACI